MPMFRLAHISETRKVVGVMAMAASLLWITSGYPLVSQGQQGSPLSRSSVVTALKAPFTTLVAGTAPILLSDEAGFISLPDVTVAAIPRAQKEFLESFAEFMALETDSIDVGGFYVSDPIKVRNSDKAYTTVPPGAYIVKLVRNRQAGTITAHLVNIEGDVILRVPATVTIIPKEVVGDLPPKPWIQISNNLQGMLSSETLLSGATITPFESFVKTIFIWPSVPPPDLAGVQLDTLLGGPNPAFWVGVGLILIGLVIVVCSQVCGGN
jgi:hypothetical protein